MQRSGRSGRTGTAVLALTVLAALAALVPLAATSGASPPGSQIDPADLSDPTVYPQRGFFDIKGVTSFYNAPDSEALLATMGIGRLDTAWAQFEPQVVSPPCPATHAEYDGHCFYVVPEADALIKRFTDAGLPVMAIVFATPEWARGDRPCDPFNAWHDVFCTPDDPADFARFAGFLADRYDGTNGAGRITDFVIQNEVNMNQWFNNGCGKGIPCDFEQWVDDFAQIYNTAYDAIRSHQPAAKVMIPLTHHLETSFDQPDLVHPVWSVKTFLPPVVAKLGDREWSIAHHPYPRSVDPSIDARDLPHATMGNLGVLLGWLRATFPDDSHAWEIELTEQGMNNPGLFDDLHARELCDAFRGVLGTPGIRSFIYHSLRDNPGEFGLALGLHEVDGTPKPALATWRDANDPDNPTCGFENFPHTIVRHGVDLDADDHWFSSRPLPRGYRMLERQWRLHYEAQPGTTMAYECGDGDASTTPPSYPAATFLWTSADCDGAFPMGPVGWIDTSPAAGLAPIYTCDDGERRLSSEGPCPAGQSQALVGYAVAEDVPADVLEEANQPDPDDPEDPDPEDPTDPDIDLSAYDVAFALREGSFRIGRLDPISLPDGDPTAEGTTYLVGTWDESTGDLEVELLAPPFTSDVQTTILPDPVPTTMALTQVGGGTGHLDPATGAFSLDVVIDTKLTSPDPLFQLFLGANCILGPTSMTLVSSVPFDLAAAAPSATVGAAGFLFPAAHGCGTNGDLDATLNPALGLPTDDTESHMTFAIVKGAPAAQPPVAVPGSGSVVEGDDDTVLQVPISLSAPAAHDVAVPWRTLDPPSAPFPLARSHEDFEPTSGTVTIPAGQTSGVAEVPILDDDVAEPTELAVVSFHTPIGARLGGYWGLGFGTIVDDDDVLVLPGSGAVVEGDAGTTTLLVDVTLSRPAAAPVTVEWQSLNGPEAPPGAASAGSDLEPASGTVTFEPGQTSAQVAITVLADTLSEPDELVVLAFHSPTGASVGGYWGLGFAVIHDDD